ncbi:DnaJ-domain-containing protein, partial [Gyrodon lividus]
MVKHSTISEAYTLLGLQQGAPMEQIRTAYKQLALRMHPDKNQGNAGATAQFQQLSEAYNVLQKHLDNSAEPRRYYPCGRSDDDDDDDYDEDDDYYFYDDDDEYEADRMRFFKLADYHSSSSFFFEEILKGRSGRGYRRAHDPHYRRPRTPETPEEYEARLKRTREEQEQAEARRTQKKAERKAFEARMREKERKEAEGRQKAKADSKKAEAENQRKRATQTAQVQQQRVQTLRSATFTAARAGDAAKVKKGVWEDEVDPSGGEIKLGCEKYIATQPQDPKETLLHIAARKGDVELVEWLDAH